MKLEQRAVLTQEDWQMLRCGYPITIQLPGGGVLELVCGDKKINLNENGAKEKLLNGNGKSYSQRIAMALKNGEALKPNEISSAIRGKPSAVYSAIYDMLRKKTIKKNNGKYSLPKED